MLLAMMLAAATATAPAAKAPETPAKGAAAPTLDLVPAFIGACMNPGPEVEKIREVVTKAGGKPLPQDPKAPNVQGYLFEVSGLNYSVIVDKSGTCSVVGGRVNIDATRSSLDQLVIGSSKVFDISQTEAKPHGAGESVVVEYKLSSKNDNGGLTFTLSKVSREGKEAVFLTRRIFAKQ